LHNPINIFVVGSVAVCLLVAGCGGSGDSAGAQQIDKATFVEQVNEICERASGKLAAEFASINARESAKPGYDLQETQITVVEKALIPRLEEELKQIRALGMPDDAKKDAEALLKAYQKGIERTKAESKAAIEGFIPYEVAELAATKIGASECPIAAVSSPGTN
jgi:hypothetical protein